MLVMSLVSIIIKIVHNGCSWISYWLFLDLIKWACLFVLKLFIFCQCMSGRNSVNPAIWLVPAAGRIFRSCPQTWEELSCKTWAFFLWKNKIKMYFTGLGWSILRKTDGEKHIMLTCLQEEARHLSCIWGCCVFWLAQILALFLRSSTLMTVTKDNRIDVVKYNFVPDN